MRRYPVGYGNQGRARFAVVLLLAGVSVGMIALVASRCEAELTGPGPGDRRVTLSVSTLLQRLHLARRPLDDEMSARCLDNFLKKMDPMKIHFRQSDVDEFNSHRTKIDDEVRRGDVRLAYQIFRRFLARVEERNRMVDQILEMEHDFDVDEEMVSDPDELAYPANRQEAFERWRKRIKYELLLQKADEVELAEAKEKLKRRYRSYAKRMAQTDNDELLEMYLTSMTNGYDPHTTYMSASTLENFEILMRLELDGIGASLQFEDGYTLVHKIVPGGAADKDGRLKVKDRIISVGQGPEGEMVDVVDMKLGDVVKLIRGKRGSIVRLGVVPAGGKKTQIYDITRARIELKDSEARSEIVSGGQKEDGTPFTVGWIDLPSFYMDMAGARLGRPDFKSTTRDVRRILKNFREKQVDAVVVDLRRNGGGSLTEAVNLTGLFIESGPIVQVKGFDGSVEPYEDTDAGIAWTGPLVVVTSKFSASASEIFAGAIQDYQRGLIVGDHATHGKGTVQQLLDLGHQIFRIPNAPKLGALKITIQQFYRPSGDSTQNRGVLTDIELPSLTTHLDVGESDLDYALEFNRVPAVSHKQYGYVNENVLQRVKALSTQRLAKSEDFIKVRDNIRRYKEQKDRKKIELNEEEFLSERAELNADEEEEKKIEELNEPSDEVVKKNFYFDETIAITRDYANLLRQKHLAGRVAQ